MIETVTSPAEKIVDELFADLRDRRFLKWLFKEEEGVIGDFPQLQSLDLDVQQEIRTAWVKIISKGIATSGQFGTGVADQRLVMIAERAEAPTDNERALDDIRVLSTPWKLPDTIKGNYAKMVLEHGAKAALDAIKDQGGDNA